MDMQGSSALNSVKHPNGIGSAEQKRAIERSIEEYDVHQKIRDAREEMNHVENYVTGSIASSMQAPSITASELFSVGADGIINILQDLKTLVDTSTKDGADPALCRLCTILTALFRG